MTIFWQILVQIILIALNAVFAAAEIAVISMNDAKLTKLAEEGNKKAVKLAKLTAQPARFLATIQVAITLAGFLGSAFAADNFAGPLTHALIGAGVSIPANILETICVIIITLILSYITLIFGELVPKRVAMKNSEKLALGISGTISFISTIFAPVVWMLTISTNSILRLMGIDPNSEDEEVTEEEIRMMVDVGSEKGTIDVEEKEFIQNVFEFDDLSIDEVATHRTDTIVLWLEDDMDEWDKVIRTNLHPRFPVCGDSIDDVRGVLDARNYFRLSNKSRECVMRHAVAPAFFVPYNMKADVLFRNMKNTAQEFAVVLDEYGGVHGIITINDLIWELVGSINDPSQPGEEPEIKRVGNDIWRIQGAASVDDVERAIGVKIPEGDYDTFGGYVFSILGRIPEDGDVPDLDMSGMKVLFGKIKDHRLKYIQVKRIIEEEKE